jgi:hypothetical protein
MRYFIQPQRPKFRPSGLNLQQARIPIFLAARLDAGAVLKFLIE